MNFFYKQQRCGMCDFFILEMIDRFVSLNHWNVFLYKIYMPRDKNCAGFMETGQWRSASSLDSDWLKMDRSEEPPSEVQEDVVLIWCSVGDPVLTTDVSSKWMSELWRIWCNAAEPGGSSLEEINLDDVREKRWRWMEEELVERCESWWDVIGGGWTILVTNI